VDDGRSEMGFGSVKAVKASAKPPAWSLAIRCLLYQWAISRRHLRLQQPTINALFLLMNFLKIRPFSSRIWTSPGRIDCVFFTQHLPEKRTKSL
jgi:hypothetical protein